MKHGWPAPCSEESFEWSRLLKEGDSYYRSLYFCQALEYWKGFLPILHVQTPDKSELGKPKM